MNDLLPAQLLENDVIPRTMLLMVLMLPVIGTIIGIAKHIIGVQSLGIYAPVILTYAYFQLGLSSNHKEWIDIVIYGLKTGFLLTFIVFITSVITHIITKKIRLHYSPKIAIVLTSVAISMYMVIIVANATDKTTFLNGGFLPIILIATIAEQFVSIMAQKDIKTSISLTLATVLISGLTFMLIIYQPFQDLIINKPYFLLITIVINFFVGKFTGLRILEYWRFRDILNKEN